MSSNIISGRIHLYKNAESVPDEGLTSKSLRIELAEITKPDLGWIAELNTVDILPWFKGEERNVEIRIMSDEFYEVVSRDLSELLIKRGNNIIGKFSQKIIS